MQAETLEGLAEHLAGHQDCKIGAAGHDAHKDSRNDGRSDEAADAADAARDLLQDDLDAARLAVDAAESESAENQQNGTYHAHESAAVKQGVDLRNHSGGIDSRHHADVESAVKGGGGRLKREALENAAHDDGQHRREEHHRYGRLAQKGAEQNDDRRQQKQKVKMEH